MLGLANTGNDTVHSVTQAREFGLGRRSMRIALTYFTDVHTIGLQTEQCMRPAECLHWDLNSCLRAVQVCVKGRPAPSARNR